MTQSDGNFKCSKCGHTKSKDGKTGNSGYDKVKKIGSTMSFGTRMIISCCASCGDVHSIRIENPDKL